MDRKEFGAWFREQRLRRGVRAATVSRRAGLSVGYISDFERGKTRPKSASVDRLAAALAMSDQERAEFHRLAIQAGEPETVRQAIAGPSIPGLVVWKYLPEALLSLNAAWRLTAIDDVCSDVVPAAASVLAWSRLKLKAPTLQQRRHLVKLAREEYRWSIDTGTKLPRGERWGKREATTDAIAALPAAWRGLVFADRAATRRAVSTLSGWEYVPGAAYLGDTSLLDVRFADPQFGYDIGWIPPLIVRWTHDLMVAWRLWHDLSVADAIGIRLRRWPLGGNPFEDELKAVDAAAAGNSWHALTTHVDLIRFGLRLFDHPQLASAVFGRSRDAIEQQLSAAERTARKKPAELPDDARFVREGGSLYLVTGPGDGQPPPNHPPDAAPKPS